MVIRKYWQTRHTKGLRIGQIKYQYDGWFIFWIIPIYVKRDGVV
jgi:hypothetical protein